MGAGSGAGAGIAMGAGGGGGGGGEEHAARSGSAAIPTKAAKENPFMCILHHKCPQVTGVLHSLQVGRAYVGRVPRGSAAGTAVGDL